MDLAEDIGGGRYRIAEGLADTLRRMGVRGDIVRFLQREPRGNFVPPVPEGATGR